MNTMPDYWVTYANGKNRCLEVRPSSKIKLMPPHIHKIYMMLIISRFAHKCVHKLLPVLKNKNQFYETCSGVHRKGSACRSLMGGVGVGGNGGWWGGGGIGMDWVNATERNRSLK
jgi:hypothetical protein